MLNHIGTREIATERLLLRRFRMDDAEAMFRGWASDGEVTRYLTWQPHGNAEVTKKLTASWVEQYARKDCYRWCIVWKENGEPIGCIDVVRLVEELETGVIGYCMAKEYWGRGVMTEALAAVMEYLFVNVGLYRIQAYHQTQNPASGKVMKKCGMQFEGVLRQSAKTNAGEYCDVAYYSILRPEWRRQHPSVP